MVEVVFTCSCGLRDTFSSHKAYYECWNCGRVLRDMPEEKTFLEKIIDRIRRK